MINRIIYISTKLAWVILPMVFILIIRCSSRQNTPVTSENSTISYPPKMENGITASISFGRYVSKKTGKLIGEASLFDIKKKAKMVAIIDLQNIFVENNQSLMFHVEWIAANGKTFYIKEVILNSKDSTSSLRSTISLSPEKREEGSCLLKVYLFRELIAEREFKLRPEPIFTPELFESLTSNIILYRKLNKKTGKRIGEGSAFTIKSKEKIRTVIKLKNCFTYWDEELNFNLNWVDENGQSFYKKKITFSPKDTTIITSSISISPGKRKPGNYALQLSLFNKVIAEKNFEILPEPKKITKKKSDFKAEITFYKSDDKKTGKYSGIGERFLINEKGKVYAIIKVSNKEKYSRVNNTFKLQWIGPNGRSFFSKKIDIPAGDQAATLTSSISATPKKRKPGSYKLRVFLSDELIGEKKFILIEKSN